MNLYLNYEDAQELLNDTNLFVVRTTSVIHRAMLESANRRCQPSEPFDMRYFYDAAVRSIASVCNYDLAKTSTSCHVAVVNLPQLDDPSFSNDFFVRSGAARTFVDLVQSESVEDGCPFDLGFACSILTIAVDEPTLAFIQEAIGQTYDSKADSFDDWLEGFSIVDQQFTLDR